MSGHTPGRALMLHFKHVVATLSSQATFLEALSQSEAYGTRKTEAGGLRDLAKHLRREASLANRAIAKAEGRQ